MRRELMGFILFISVMMFLIMGLVAGAMYGEVWIFGEKLRILSEAGLDADLVSEIAKALGK